MINCSAAVQFTFRQPMYMFFENVGSGQVCVDKSGITEETIRVRISGGEAIVSSYTTMHTQYWTILAA